MGINQSVQTRYFPVHKNLAVFDAFLSNHDAEGFYADLIAASATPGLYGYAIPFFHFLPLGRQFWTVLVGVSHFPGVIPCELEGFVFAVPIGAYEPILGRSFQIMLWHKRPFCVKNANLQGWSTLRLK